MAIERLFGTHSIRKIMGKEQVLDSLSTVSSSSTFYTDCWFWIALVELLFIVISAILYMRKKWENNPKRELKKRIKAEGAIDFDNTMMSAFHSQELYNELKGKYHPDRFPNDTEKNELATILFQQIVENKKNGPVNNIEKKGE